MAKSSQISTTNPQTPNYTFTSKAHPPKKKHCIKSMPYTLARRINKLITDKNLKKKKKLALKNYTKP